MPKHAAEPKTAELFAPYPFPFEPPQGKHVVLKSFEEFATVANEHSNRHGVAWRGQANAKWRLTSSAFRSEKARIELYFAGNGIGDHAKDICCISQEVENRMKHASRRVQMAIGTDPHLRLLYQDELVDKNIHDDHARYGELLSICQHFGMETPLLDVTDSAYVALYFASWFAMKQSAAWRQRNRMAVWKIPAHMWAQGLSYDLVPDVDAGELARDQSAYEEQPDRPVPHRTQKITISNVFPRKYRNERLVAQQGSFIRVVPDLPLDHVLTMMHLRNGDYVGDSLSEQLIQYTLPAKHALDCLIHLTKMNIGPHTLFPDMTGQMDSINMSAVHYDYSGMTSWMRGSNYDMTGTRREDECS